MFHEADFSKRVQFQLLIVLSILTATIYLFNLSSEFIRSLDDDWIIFQNPQVQNFNLETLKQMWLNETADVYYMPLTFTILGVIVDVFGNNAYIFKTVNLVLFISSAWVLFYIFQLLKIKGKVIIATLIPFLLHPILVENIAWAISLRQALSVFFGFLSLLIICRFYLTNGKYSFLNHIFSIFTFILSLASKFTSVSILIMAFSLIFINYLDSRYHEKGVKIKISYIIPHFLVALFFFLMNSKSFDRNFLYQEFNYDLLQHIFIIVGSFGFYVKHIFTGEFSFFYPIENSAQFDYRIYAIRSAMTLVLIVILVYGFLRKNKILTISIGWYFFAMIPPSLLLVFMSDLPINTADRYFAYGSPWLFLLFASLLAQLSNKIFLPIIFGLTILLSNLTIKQIHRWDDIFALLKYNVDYYPSEEMCQRLAVEYYKDGDKANCRYYLAKAEKLDRSIEFNNPYPFYLQLAYIHQDLGQIELALETIHKSLEKDLQFNGIVDYNDELQSMFPLDSDIKNNIDKYQQLRNNLIQNESAKFNKNRW